jgi:O-antigen/teichoic acid export membrane protein
LGFFLVAAHAMTVSGFGVVRYTITLATLALAPMLVLATATNRELGASRGGEQQTGVVLAASVTVGACIFVATAALCVMAGVTDLTGSASLAGLLVVLGGLALFNLYYQIARGLGHIRRIAVVYVGGSLIKLAVLLALIAVADVSPIQALVIFGVSSGVTVIAYELAAPVIRGRAVWFGRDGMRSLWRIGAPLIIAQLGYMIWISADQIWVESTFGAEKIGLYGAAKTLVQAFFVLTAGSIGVMMPRVAELRTAGQTRRARRLIVAMSAQLLALSVLMGAFLVLARSPLLTLLFGEAYDGAGSALIALAVSMVVYGAFIGITASAIGWGRPGISALGVSVAALSEIALLVLAGGDGIAFAGWVNAVSIGLGLVAVALALARRPLR